jgi:hypothetical protein
MKPFRATHEAFLKQTGPIALADGAQPGRRQEATMNHSIQSADRATHLKVVVVALVAGAALTTLGMSARSSGDFVQIAHVIKAGQPTMITSSGTSLVR